MNKVINLLIIIVFYNNLSLASGQEFGPIVQRQAKQIKELQTRIGYLESNMNALQAQINQKDGQQVTSNKGELASQHEEVASPDKEFFKNQSQVPQAQSIAQDKTDYDLALATLKKGEFEEAEKMFADFLQKYPNSKLAENAVFWYGETFYHREIFNKAALNYLQGYKQYPKGAKAADSLLKLSFSLASLNKNKEACSMLDKLDSEFPNRPINSIKRAQDARSKFGCK